LERMNFLVSVQCLLLLSLESKELEVLEQPEQFSDQLTVNHQYDHHA
nr:hypothetical protein [Tanacetum cinerariifolium]